MNWQLARDVALTVRETLPRSGKMFGVLVARRGEALLTLKAFSGMLDGQWHVDGFVGPAFHPVRHTFEGPAAAEIAEAEHHKALSQALMRRIHDTYVFANRAGETRTLRELFAPYEPPAGAGDCAAPKLLAYAFAQGLEPVSLAEFFWGEGPRTHGEFYPPCDTKCAPILAFMLPPPSPRVLFEDEAIVVVEKPAGLLSVPGRSAMPSVQQWLGHANHRLDASVRPICIPYTYVAPAMLAHRLDQDTSGLLVAGKTAAVYKHLQRQFGERKVHKEYVAVLDREVDGTGVITLPLLPDISARPKQMHHAEGYEAITEYRASAGRVVFTPRTGRTHQLRVHAQLALAPIKGDRLYGTMSDRLYLHAHRLGFTHPNGTAMMFESEVPF